MNDLQMLNAALTASKEAQAAGRHAEGLFEAELALAMAQRLTDEGAVAQAHVALAHHRFALGQFEAAVAHGVKALPRLADPAERCDLQCRIVGALSELDLNDEALSHARQALDVARQHALAAGLVQALCMLGGLVARLHDHDHGEELLMQALSRAREQQDPLAVLRAVNTLLAVLIHAYEAQRDAGEAQRAAATLSRLVGHTRHAMLLCQQETHGFRRTILRSNIAHGLMVAGFLDDALDLLKSSLAQATEEGYAVVRLKILSRVAQCRLQQGDVAGARADFEAMLPLQEGADLLLARTDTLRRLADVARLQGDANLLMRLTAEVDGLLAQHEARQQAARQQLRQHLQAVHATLAVVDAEWAKSRPATL